MNSPHLKHIIILGLGMSLFAIFPLQSAEFIPLEPYPAPKGIIEIQTNTRVTSPYLRPIKKILVKKGHYVKKGQLLVQFDTSSEERLIKESYQREKTVRTHIKKYENWLSDAIHNYQKKYILFQEHLVTQDSLDTLAQKQAEYQLHLDDLFKKLKIEAEIQKKNQAQIRRLKLWAPASGLITKQTFQVGITPYTLPNGPRHVTEILIGNTKNLAGKFRVDPLIASLFSVGDLVRLRLDDENEHEFPGIISEITPKSQKKNQKFQIIQIGIAKPNPNIIKPGMTCELIIESPVPLPLELFYQQAQKTEDTPNPATPSLFENPLDYMKAFIARKLPTKSQ